MRAKSQLMWPLLGVTMLALVGCQDRNNNGQPDSVATGTQIEKTLDDAGKTIEKGVDKAVPVIEKTVEDGAKIATDAATTGKVKTALMADKTISASEIDVDTKNRVVHLRGTVQNAAQKNLAGHIAKKQAGNGFSVKNELKVTGGKPATTKKQ